MVAPAGPLEPMAVVGAVRPTSMSVESQGVSGWERRSFPFALRVYREARFGAGSEVGHELVGDKLSSKELFAGVSWLVRCRISSEAVQKLSCMNRYMFSEVQHFILVVVCFTCGCDEWEVFGMKVLWMVIPRSR